MRKFVKVAGLIGLCLLLIPAVASAKTVKKGSLSRLTMKGTSLAAEGTVASIDGSSINLNGNNQVAYIVDTSKAKIMAGRSTLALAEVKSGDSLRIFGSLSGTSIAATKIIDSSRVTTKPVVVKRHLKKNINNKTKIKHKTKTK